MSKIKKSLLYCLTMLLAFGFLISPFPSPAKDKPHQANAEEIQLVDDNVLKYVTISTAELVLSSDKLKNVDSNGDGKNDTSFIFANGTISLNFKPFEYNYTATFTEDQFYKTTFEKILEKDAEGNFPTTFLYGETEVSYQVSAGGNFTFKADSSTSSVSDQLSDFISVEETETTRKFTFITCYTLKADAPSTSFTFSLSTAQQNVNVTKYTLNFERPVSNFKTDYVTYFSCKDLSGNTSHNEIIERELSYENVKIQFTNNDYTKNNPLYFDINYNGFVYTFMLYNENISGTDYLFVEYYDEQRSGNNRSLATILDENGSVKTGVKKYVDATTDFNLFSLDFNKTGRYEISVYDSTYLLLKNKAYYYTPKDEDPTDNIKPEPELVIPEANTFNYNFYQTSFYIKTSETDADSAFDNAYVIMQSYDDDGNYLDYIVSTSTQNNNVEITLKNLSYYFENDEAIKNFTATETLPDLNVVEFRVTTLAGSANIPKSTFYTLSQLKEALETNKDFNINCSEDAFYEIIIYRFDKTTYAVTNKKAYQFTIVKDPKISFTVYEVDANNDPIEVPGSSPVEYQKTIHEADTPYKAVPKNYKININSNMIISTFFCDKLVHEYNFEPLPQAEEIDLPKTYLNQYTINFAMQEVDIKKVSVTDPNDEDKTLLGFQFFGVGEIMVQITVNSVTTTYTVKSGDILSFEAYGTYSIAIEDSMGTVGTAVFNYKKPVSMSAIILVVLCGVIALAVVLFVISSRGRVKTR